MISDSFRLDNKVVVITGAAGLLGCQHADAVAQAGGIPILLDLKKDAVELLAIEIEQRHGVEAMAYQVDISCEKEVSQNLEEILGRYGKVDALVNNAANNPKMESSEDKNFSRLENFPLELWHQDLSVGLTGAFLCSKHYGKAISQNHKGGVIINISSDLGLIAPDQRLYRQAGLQEDQQPVKPVTYSVIKTGIIGLTRYLSTYWPERVRCNAICPGGVLAGQPAEFVKQVSEHIPLGRMAKPDEYQGTLVFLLSENSTYINGAVLSVDGGRVAW